MSQCNDILRLLQDHEWHSATDIAEKAYQTPRGATTIARVASRIFDLKNINGKFKCNIESRMTDHNGVRCAEYRLVPEGQLMLL